ncbi:MAG TPA: VWA domain-containing protein, partial [Terriglobales bacterium]|nr:VWA domain-containing protein [Terriglobales bacterium]
MKNRGLVIWVAMICVGCGLAMWLGDTSMAVHAQAVQTQPAPDLSIQQPPATNEQPASQATVFKAQTKLVLVDSIVTDKKGNYIRDLQQKNFRIWEDNKEQEVKSFSYESGNASPNNPMKRYLVLFFDNSSMEFGDQAAARQAATKFIDDNAGPNRQMAIADFGGTLRITQNFTADAERLKKVVAGTKFSTVSPNGEVASLGAPPIMSAESDFGARSMLWAVRDLAKNLATVPGRKSLVLLTAGFPLTPERQSELSAVIDACNKANVAVYPIDVRGLVVLGIKPASGAHLSYPVLDHPPRLVSATLNTDDSAGGGTPHLIFVQHGGGAGGGGGHGGGGGGTGGGGGHGGGGGTGGGGGHGGGTGGGGHGGTGGGGHGGTGGTGGRGGTGGTGGRGGVGSGYSSANAFYNNPNAQPRNIIPQFPESSSTNQQVLFALAEGTGGFVIHDSNDLLGGMERIAKEQDEYYIVGYTPPDSKDGSCHTIKVKVDESKTIVRSRSGYCNVKPVDLLAGKPIERELENHATASQAGNISGSLEAPFFFTSANVARVSVAMEMPSNSIKFDKEKGKFKSDINVLGIANKPDGTEAARFSDTVHLELEKKELEEFNTKPFVYENQFDIASGQYQLSVVFSSGGESFGKLQAALAVDPYDGKHFNLSPLALSKETHPISDLAQGLDADLMQGDVPLVYHGVQIVPAADYHFKKTDPAVVYMEIYAPSMAESNPPQIGLQYAIVDTKTGQAKISTGIPKVSDGSGRAVLPLGLKVPV